MFSLKKVMNKHKFIIIIVFILPFLIYYYLGNVAKPEVPLFVDLHKHYKNTYIRRHFETLNCPFGRPCVYKDPVDFRIIVLTFSRAASLLKLLSDLQHLHLDHSTVALEIWVDRNKEGKVNLDTLRLAHSFNWTKGTLRCQCFKNLRFLEILIKISIIFHFEMFLLLLQGFLYLFNYAKLL